MTKVKVLIEGYAKELKNGEHGQIGWQQLCQVKVVSMA